MKENQKIKEVKKDNIVNDYKLEKDVIEEQEKCDLYYRAGISCNKNEERNEIDPYDKVKLVKNLFKINIDIDTISEVTGLTKNKILNIKEVLNLVSNGNFERELIEVKEKCDLDYRKKINYIKKKGYDEGHATGLAEGKLEKEKLIKDLLKMNIDIDTISKATGLTKNELDKLKKQI